MRTVLLLLAAALATADELVLADGRVLEGDLLSAPGAAEVVLRHRSGGMVAEQRFPRAQVAEERRGPTARQTALAALERRRTDLDPGAPADAWWTLARDYRTLGEGAEARRCAQRVLDRDPDHAEARAFLGWVRQDDRWMRPVEAALARGEVLFRGRWITPAERDAVLAEEARSAAEAAERERARTAAEEERARQARARQEQAPPPSWVAFGNVSPVPTILLRDPARWAPMTPAPCPTPPTVEVQAQGGGSGVQWGLHYRR